ncbi:EpsG family protein [Gallibacterium anatis]|jgi:hypothetical protein|uniref:EpsG family protein n=1 Tax=Gallibacterium anatis TaxID=750 RepID=UPI0005310008|nr:EpsG family protein [Gallibacterium anatis]KGQ41814.1 hypothetical protein JP30_02940 [Gallibacterium anatis IPDH697-78]MDK9560459.1 EpsG family protein [Gallibacterium anatis]
MMVEHYIFLLLSSLTLLQSNSRELKLIVELFKKFFLLGAFLFISFRSFNTGNDTRAYLELFQSIPFFNSLSDYLSSNRYEPGFMSWNYFFYNNLTENFTLYLLAVNGFYFSVSIYFYNKYAKNAAWVFLWFIFGIYYAMFTTMRACLALAFIYLVIDSLFKNKKLRFIIFSILAILFHSSSALIITLFLMVNKKTYSFFKYKTLLLVIAGIGAYFLNIIASVFPYYSHYLDSSYVGIRMASIFNFIILFGLYWISYINEINKDLFLIKVNCFFYCQVLMSFASIQFNLLDRFTLFLYPFVIIYLCVIFPRLKLNRKVLIMLLIGILIVYQVLTFIYRPNWKSIYPYHFVDWLDI